MASRRSRSPGSPNTATSRWVEYTLARASALVFLLSVTVRVAIYMMVLIGLWELINLSSERPCIESTMSNCEIRKSGFNFIISFAGSFCGSPVFDIEAILYEDSDEACTLHHLSRFLVASIVLNTAFIVASPSYYRIAPLLRYRARYSSILHSHSHSLL